MAVPCAIIRSNFSSRKYYSPILPFFFFLSLWRCFCLFLVHFAPGALVGEVGCGGPGSLGCARLLSLGHMSLCRACPSLSAGSCGGEMPAVWNLQWSSWGLAPCPCRWSGWRLGSVKHPPCHPHARGAPQTVSSLLPRLLFAALCWEWKAWRVHPVIMWQSLTASSVKSGVRNEPKSRHRWWGLSTLLWLGPGRQRCTRSPRPSPGLLGLSFPIWTNVLKWQRMRWLGGMASPTQWTWVWANSRR